MEKTKKKPKWLRALEAESWQAELLISGIAIYGSLQLPNLLNKGIDYAILHFPDAVLDPIYFVFWYLIIVSAVLIINFILHFILRALWISMIGLVSVFPDGVKRDTDFYSEHFMDQVLKEFPDVNEFILRLDKLCSQIFAFSFAFAFSFFSFTLVISIGLILGLIISSIFPSISPNTFFTAYIIIVLGPALISSILNAKKLREKKWVKKIHFPFFVKIWARVLFTFFYEPSQYISLIYITNSKQKGKLGLTFGLYIFIAMLFAGIILFNSNAIYLRHENFHRLGKRADKVYPSNYTDQIKENETVLEPIIPSDQIKGNLIKLFIPLARRENTFIDDICGAYQKDEALSRQENRNASRAHKLKCLEQYLEISINDTKISGLKYTYKNHPNNREPGVVTYVPTTSCQIGKNNLKIKSAFTNDEGEYRENNIPFWFLRE